jgi:hypothetical protein
MTDETGQVEYAKIVNGVNSIVVRELSNPEMDLTDFVHDSSTVN